MESSPPILFDRARYRKRRARAASQFIAHDFLWHEAASRAEESLSYIARNFPRMAGFGTHCFTPPKSTATFIHADLSAAMLQHAPHPKLAADEESFPFAENSLDAVVSLLSLQWANDLPGALKQIWQALKPDGLFFAILPGGETLRELRSTFAAVESNRHGGITPRVAPFIDVRDGGTLLQRAGFALPVADSEIIDVSYENLFTLMNDLRGSAQSNMLQHRLQHFTPRGFFYDAAGHYAQHYSDAEKRITATIELVTLTGWKPALSQQQPAKRGSGKVSLRDVLN